MTFNPQKDRGPRWVRYDTGPNPGLLFAALMFMLYLLVLIRWWV